MSDTKTPRLFADSGTGTILPVLILFLVLQRHYIQGLLLGSVKG